MCMGLCKAKMEIELKGGTQISCGSSESTRTEMKGG
jgi:hypothetical protein